MASVRQREHSRFRGQQQMVSMLVAGAFLLLTPVGAWSADFVVDSNGDNGDSVVGDGVCNTHVGTCTLRAAIEEAQATELSEPVTISFGASVEEIVVGSLLPALNRAVSILGNSTLQGPSPVIDGRDVPGGNGLTLRAGGVIADITVVGFPGYGVVLRNGQITGTHLGVMPDGVTVRANQSGGLSVLGASIVGGARVDGERCTGLCNLIAGNRDSQVSIGEIGAVIIGNQIGVLADGTLATGLRDVIRLPGGTLVPTAMVTIGGSLANANLVAAPASAVSVRIFRALGPASQSVRIAENTFVGPGTSLVDLDLGGQLPNDAGDGDAGPNGLLNFPFLRAANINANCRLGLELITAPGRVVDAWLVLNNGRIEHAFSVVEGSVNDTSSAVDSYSDPQLGADSGNVLATSVSLRPFAAASRIIFIASDASGNSSESVVFDLPSGTEACTSICFSDRDGDGVTGTREQIVSGACGDVNTNGTIWTTESGGDCLDDPSDQCATASVPGNVEVCDGCDNDCDGLVDDDDKDIAIADPAITGAFNTRFYSDADNDGCGFNDGNGFYACAPIDGFVNNQLDVDDTDGRCCGNGVLDPGEVCDGEAIGSAMCTDGSAGTPICLNDPRHPNGRAECRFRNGTAFGCSFGRSCFADLDGDGFTGSIVGLDDGDDRSCSDFSSGPLDTPWTDTFGGDCEDRPSSDCALETFPGALDVCDGCDNDCDPSTADGFGEATFGQPCDGPDLDLCPEGIIVCNSNQSKLACSDITGTTIELCDESDADEDCNGLVNDADPGIGVDPEASGSEFVYRDADDDGCGAESDRMAICVGTEIPEGYVSNTLDLNDTDGFCCGDGVLSDGEECEAALPDPPCSDFGFSGGFAICRESCTISLQNCANEDCGDGVLSGVETCDPLAASAPENCRPNCTFCGDGILDDLVGETCDVGDGAAPENCRDDCTFCGDGRVDVEAGETCDPAAPDAPGFCDPVSCTTCGDGVVDTELGEECDDGSENTIACPYGVETCATCSTTCTLIDGEPRRCGDGVVQAEFGETCDDGNTVTEVCEDQDCSVCAANCKLVQGAAPRCGDGVVQAFAGEDCEPNVGDAIEECRDDCTLVRSSDGDSSGSGGCSTSSRIRNVPAAVLIVAGLLALAITRRRMLKEGL